MKVLTYVLIISTGAAVGVAMQLAHDRLTRPSAPDIGWPVELIPEPEASAYYDGRKLINDNQRAYIDKLAEEARAKQ